MYAVTCFPDGPMPYKRQGGKYTVFAQTESSLEIIACMNDYTHSVVGYDYSSMLWFVFQMVPCHTSDKEVSTQWSSKRNSHLRLAHAHLTFFGIWLFIQAATFFPDGPMPYKRQGGKYTRFAQTESSHEIIACMNNYTHGILGYDYSSML